MNAASASLRSQRRQELRSLCLFLNQAVARMSWEQIIAMPEFGCLPQSLHIPRRKEARTGKTTARTPKMSNRSIQYFLTLMFCQRTGAPSLTRQYQSSKHHSLLLTCSPRPRKLQALPRQNAGRRGLPKCNKRIHRLPQNFALTRQHPSADLARQPAGQHGRDKRKERLSRRYRRGKHHSLLLKCNPQPRTPRVLPRRLVGQRGLLLPPYKHRPQFRRRT